MLDAVALGALAQSALLLSGILVFYLVLPSKVLGALGGFGAGALLVAIMTDLVPEEQATMSPQEVGLWLLIGCAVFILANRFVQKKYGGEGSGNAMGIVVGAIVDGVPESLIFGIQLATGIPISLQFLGAVWISNLPQSFVPSADLAKAGWSKGKLAMMWGGVVVACGVAAGLGYFLALNVSGVNGSRMAGIAAGGLLAMLTNAFIPFAYEHGGEWAGIGLVVGFVLSLVA